MRRPTLKNLKAAMRQTGNGAPYLNELKRQEVEAWMDRYLNTDQRAKVNKRARELQEA